MSIKRNLRAVALLAGLGGYGLLAAAVHLERFPRPSLLVQRANLRLTAAHESLSGAGPIPERWLAYRGGLQEAEALLRQALIESPVRGEPAIGLAAILWETGPPESDPEREAWVRLAEAGATLVPQRSQAQERAGELLLRMGRREAGVSRLRAAVELDPQRTGDVVETLLAGGVEAAQVRRILPPTAAVLAALSDAYPTRESWLVAVEAFEGPPSRELLLRYAAACRESGDPERLVRRLLAIGEQADPAVEVERRVQHADALLALGDSSGAVVAAEAARRLVPEDVRVAEYLGTVLLRGGDAEAALTVFRDALRTAALVRRPPAESARLYRWLGQAHEQRRRPDLAVDAYRLAIGLDAGESVSQRRMAELDAAFRAGG